MESHGSGTPMNESEWQTTGELRWSIGGGLQQKWQRHIATAVPIDGHVPIDGRAAGATRIEWCPIGEYQWRDVPTEVV